MIGFAIIIACAGVIGFPLILLIGAALNSSSSLGRRGGTRAEVTGRPGGEVATSLAASRRDETQWRDELFESATKPCEYRKEGLPCALVHDLDREDWCRPCLSAAAVGLPVVSLPQSPSVPVDSGPGAEVARPGAHSDGDANAPGRAPNFPS